MKWLTYQGGLPKSEAGFSWRVPSMPSVVIIPPVGMVGCYFRNGISLMTSDTNGISTERIPSPGFLIRYVSTDQNSGQHEYFSSQNSNKGTIIQSAE